MATVYVIQACDNKNILPAEKFGKIRVLFPQGYQAGFSAGYAAQEMMRELSGYTAEDHLLLIGDPVLIGIAAAVAAHWSNGRVRMLKWDRQEKTYYSVGFDLYQKKDEMKDTF